MAQLKDSKETNRLMVHAVVKALGRANIPVIKASDDLAEILQLAGIDIEYKKKSALETVSASDRKHQPTAISSTDGAKIIKNLECLAMDYKENFNKQTWFIPNTETELEQHHICGNNKPISINL